MPSRDGRGDREGRSGQRQEDKQAVKQEVEGREGTETRQVWLEEEEEKEKERLRTHVRPECKRSRVKVRTVTHLPCSCDLCHTLYSNCF